MWDTSGILIVDIRNEGCFKRFQAVLSSAKINVDGVYT